MSLPADGTRIVEPLDVSDFEAVIERFEEAWRSGTRPEIGAFLSDNPAIRNKLLTELIRTEWEYRLKAGDVVSEDEYRVRFPEQFAQSDTLSGKLSQAARQFAQRRSGSVPAKTSATSGLQPGAVLGNYTILEPLGQGGMGQVFKATHRTMKRTVALKVISPKVGWTPESLERFRREVETVARLSHPNIVTAHDADDVHGVHFLAMELVSGIDLSRLVKERGPLPVEVAVDYVLQAARGLEHAHAEGIIHRDIKPANLIVSTKGVVKVLDLGLARWQHTDDEPHDKSLTHSNQVVGTVDYMSPEQALHTKYADQCSDIYSLGCTLWYLLAARPMYTGNSIMERLVAHREQPIPDLKSAVSNVAVSLRDCESPASGLALGVQRPLHYSNAAAIEKVAQKPLNHRDEPGGDSFNAAERDGYVERLDALFRRMVAKKAEERFQTMTDVIAALESLLPRPSFGSTTSPVSLLSGRSGSTTTPQRSRTSAVTLGHESRVDVGDTAPSSHSVYEETIISKVVEGLDVQSESAAVRDRITSTLAMFAEGGGPRQARRRWWAVAGLALVSAIVLYFAGVILKVETPGGTVVVEIDQPEMAGASVSIDGERKLTLKSGDEQRPITIEVPVGKHEMRVTKEGFETFTKSFTVAIKGRQPIKVHLEPVADKTDSERAVAKWVLSVGGRVRLRVAGQDGLLDMRAGGSLPTEPFTIDLLALSQQANLPRDELGRLAGLSGLIQLLITGCPTFRDDDLLALRPALRNLQGLVLDGTGVTDTGLAAIRDSTDMRILVLPNQRITDAAIDHIAALPRLEQLDLSYTQISDHGLAALPAMPSLHSLSFTATRITGSGCVELSKFPILAQVILGEIGVNGFEHLAKLPQLKNVGLDIRQVTPATMDALSKAPKLRQIDIHSPDYSQFSPSQIELLARLPHLEELSIRTIVLDTAAWQQVAKLDGLIRFQCEHVPLTDDDLQQHLVPLKSLKSLLCTHTKLTPVGLAKFRAARPDVQIETDIAEPKTASDRSAAEWALSVGGEVAIQVGDDKQNIKRLANLPTGTFQTTFVAFDGDDVTDKGLLNLRGLRALNDLRLINTPRVTPKGMQVLTSLPNLSTLILDETSFTDEHLAPLCDCPKLNCLVLRRAARVSFPATGLVPVARRLLHYSWPPTIQVVQKPSSHRGQLGGG